LYNEEDEGLKKPIEKDTTNDIDGREVVEDEEKVDEEESKAKKKHQGLNSDQYLAGSAIGFSSGTLMMLLVAWLLQSANIEMTVPIILAINILPTMMGAGVATFLFTRKSRVNYLKDGIIIGLGAFIITFLYTSLLGQGVGGAYILIGFEMGGILGGLITKRVYEANA